ncbi:MAG TPA: OmpA family protein [Saprospiraceae bacterium]|nr:OmpA family protein [Saprospiraceae bacterium]HMP24338.1 OmpA family protein [Saprospiraceae bacterium]
MLYRPLLIFIFLASYFLVSGQTPRFSKTFQQAEEALLNKNLTKAIRLYEKVLDEQPGLHIARRNIGICYELMNDYASALRAYEKVIEQSEFFSRTIYFRAGLASYKTGDYEKALTYYSKFEFLLGRPSYDFADIADKEAQEEADMIAQLDNSIRACYISRDSVTFLNVQEVQNLGPNINSRADEYFPFVSNDQKLLFFTGRRHNRANENLYYSRFQQGAWTEGLPLTGKQSRTGHEGMATVVRDGKTMYFTACGREGVLGSCDIWQANVEDTEIRSVNTLQGAVNSEKWESQAAVSCDGTTLYFASDREGGYGGTDIWMSKRNLDGSWSEPVNLGPNINTPGYEESPFITNDGQTLYFSSDGHPGLGDQDIFLSRIDSEGNWSKPVNLGPPVNSAHRELCFILAADGKTGYFASDRPAGYGGLDIYTVQLGSELFSEAITFVEGFVKDTILDVPMPDIMVQIAGREPVKTDENGRFFLCIPAYEIMDISVQKDLYHPYQNEFIIPFWDNKQFYTIEIWMEPITRPVRDFTVKTPIIDTTTVEVRRRPQRRDYLHTIFFEFDKSTMTPLELNNLDAFLQQMKGKNLQRVEIIGFSDDIGTDVYNLKLSEERAKRIALHLMDNGLLVDQIYIEGRGEIRDDKPKNLNRKVEVKVSALE